MEPKEFKFNFVSLTWFSCGFDSLLDHKENGHLVEYTAWSVAEADQKKGIKDLNSFYKNVPLYKNILLYLNLVDESLRVIKC
jgi:hypothetical protein